MFYDLIFENAICLKGQIIMIISLHSGMVLISQIKR